MSEELKKAIFRLNVKQVPKKKNPWEKPTRCSSGVLGGLGGRGGGGDHFLFGSVFVMGVHAPDCDKDLDVCEAFFKEVTKVLWEGRRA